MKLINRRQRGNKSSLCLLRRASPACRLWRLWWYNRRCSNKSCVAYKSIIIAHGLFNIEMRRPESEYGEQLLSASLWKHLFFNVFLAKHRFDIQVDFFFSLGIVAALHSSQEVHSVVSGSIKPLTYRNAIKKNLKKTGLKVLYNRDNNQGQSSISKAEKHPPHQMIIFSLQLQ